MNNGLSSQVLFINISDRFAISLVIALVVHAFVILFIGFGLGETEKSQLPQALEVTLVNTRTSKPVENAAYLAQSNQEGGGTSEDQVKPETLFPSMAPSETLNVTNPSPPVFIPPPSEPVSQTELLTQDTAKKTIATDEKLEEKKEGKRVTAAELISQSMDIASLEAEISNAVEIYAKRPRNKVVTAGTKEYQYAAYMDAWRRKVEKVGNLHYPAEARRRKLSGSVTMDVTLNDDGTIRRVEILRSSGHKMLDDAALSIVHLAAPYAPFSEDIKKEADVLHIIRTWKFLSSGVQAR
ncbi:MAG: energy transducer TonB [Gammaproteobacteria bacterium]|nr:energy transducer TonB [Gammaproteobacteria bacterium]